MPIHFRGAKAKFFRTHGITAKVDPPSSFDSRNFLAILSIDSPLFALEQLANIIDRRDQNVVRLDVTGHAGNDGLGSGCFVSDKELFVTNAQVLAGAELATIIFPGGKRYEFTGTRVIDQGQEICIARMDIDDSVLIHRRQHSNHFGRQFASPGTERNSTECAFWPVVHCDTRDCQRNRFQ